MRPVNLIPPEDRRGEQAPLRTGPLPYVLLGALVAILIGITALVLVDNQIAESKSEVTTLESEDATAAAKAQQLASYTQFRDMSEQRVATVQSLADSRFDWERVMRELALVLPSNVWLTGLTATASPAVMVDGGAGSGASSGAALRAQVSGPALELNGCASGQEAVAGFVTALKDIDGVTRVGVQSSELGEEEAVSSTEIGAATGSSGDECRTRDFIAKFTLVVAFDAAPVPAEESSESAVAAPVESAESASSESSESTEAG
ncbi:MAG TPA: PilN domain-containing protein [Candidatus Dormibacteraeota bacterium]